MAKRPTSPVPSSKPVSSPVRNSAVPKPQPAPKREITREMIAKRAYEIYLSGRGGSEAEHWLQAERELRGA